MNASTKIASSLRTSPLYHSVSGDRNYSANLLLNPLFTGSTHFRFLLHYHESRRLYGGFSGTRELGGLGGMGSEVEAGVVLPATEDYVGEAVQAIRDGKVIAVPTDTLYGFACDACSAEAVNRIYEIKGRNNTSPLAISVADVSDISQYAVVDNLPDGLLQSLLPGPVTIVLGRGEFSILDKSLNPGLESIGIRIPDYSFIRTIARQSRSALALTSANLSGKPSSTSIKDFENLWGECAYVYDGGLLPGGRAGSTVIEITSPPKYKILRSGSAREETVAILKRFNLEEDKY